MKSLAAVTVLTALLLGVGVALAQRGDADSARSWQDTLTAGYELTWVTVDGGGAADLTGLADSSGLGYTLGGTAGQPDAGVLAGGGYTLGGGFWGGGVPASKPALEPKLYLPLVLRGS